METVGLFEAWELWWTGEHLGEGYRLWGLPMLWWSRAGKVLQFLGALTVVLDLVGPQALRAWGRHMNRTPFRRIRDWSAETAVMQALCAVVVIAAVRQLAPTYLRAEAWLQSAVDAALTAVRLPGWTVEVVVLALVAVVSAHHVQGRFDLSDRSSRMLDLAARPASAVLVVGFAVALAYYWLPFVLVLILVVGGFRALLYVLDRLLARPLAWLLDREVPGQPLRWTAAVAIAVGFSFDLLAS